MDIHLDLLGNAEDSLERAMELVAFGDQQHDVRRLKQAIQAIAHAIELLLKERLRRLHPCLIWERVEQYPQLTAKTVTVDQALQRLAAIGNVKLPDYDLQLLRSLRATRNAIEHFSWTTTKQEAEAIVGQALEFAFHFAAKELERNYLDYAAYRDGVYAELAASSPSFVRARANRSRNPHGCGDPEPLVCEMCRARAVDPTTRGCRLCGHWGATWAGQGFDDEELPF